MVRLGYLTSRREKYFKKFWFFHQKTGKPYPLKYISIREQNMTLRKDEEKANQHYAK